MASAATSQLLWMRDLSYAISMSVACLISYWIATILLNGLVAREDNLLGGMWAAVAAAFVFRQQSTGAIAAGRARAGATLVSFVLCLAYLPLARPNAIGMAVVLAAGTLVLQRLNRREEIITMAITTIVVMVVAIISPANAVMQPILRLADTVVGIAVGMVGSWAASLLPWSARA